MVSLDMRKCIGKRIIPISCLISFPSPTHVVSPSSFQLLTIACIIWWLPEIGVPQSSSILMGFSFVKHPAMGVSPMYGNFRLILSKRIRSCKLCKALMQRSDGRVLSLGQDFEPFKMPLMGYCKALIGGSTTQDREMWGT